MLNGMPQEQVTKAHLEASARTPHQLKIYEHDPRLPIVTDANPRLITTVRVAYQERIPRREAAAIAEVQRLDGRTPRISHCPGGGMTATVEVKVVGNPSEAIARMRDPNAKGAGK